MSAKQPRRPPRRWRQDGQYCSHGQLEQFKREAAERRRQESSTNQPAGDAECREGQLICAGRRGTLNVRKVYLGL